MISFLFLATALAAPAPSQGKTPPADTTKAAEAAPEKPADKALPVLTSDSAEDQTLSEIVNEQTALLRAINDDPVVKKLPYAEKERRLNLIAKRYERFLLQHPRDLEAVILFGKFLRLVDSRAEADTLFRRADALNPNVAVVKNQLGLYAAEEGKFEEAFPLLERAVELEPDVAVYWYQLGELLATGKDRLVEKKILARIPAEKKMQDAFRRAAELNPNEAGYKWRFAQSFFDCSETDWNAALNAWNRIADTAKTALEREVVSLYRARVLIELERFEDAQKSIAASKRPELQKTRDKLNAALNAKADAAKKPAPRIQK